MELSNMTKGQNEPMDDPFTLLVKLGQRGHMLELLQEGHLYLNQLGYFKRLEDETPRSDKDEATGYLWQMDGGTVEVREGIEDWKLFGTLEGGIRFHDTALESANVYCLHSRRASQCVTPWTLDDLEFGDTFVLFLNPKEFIERVRRAVVDAGLAASWGPVEYVDRRTYHGNMGAFRKFSERARDSEFRIMVEPGTGGPLSLRIGSLEDIAVLGEASKRLKLTPNDYAG